MSLPFILFLSVPIAVATAVVVWRRIGRRSWLWAFACVVCLEAIFFSFAMTNEPTSLVVATLALVVALPWITSGLWLYLTPLPEYAWLAAIGLPFVYFVFLGWGIFIGVSSGLFPK